MGKALEAKTFTLNGKERDFDFLVVMVKVEFLPGKRLTVPISFEYRDQELAEYSLALIQETMPDARLHGYASYDYDDEWRERLEQIERSDAQFRELLQLGDLK